MVNLKKTLIILNSLFILTTQGKDSVYNRIAQEHLNSFKPIINKQIIRNSIDPKTGKIKKGKIQKYITKNFTIPRNYTEITLELFNQSIPSNKNNNQEETTNTKTSKNLFKNLEVLCGEHITSSHLLAKIDRTISYSGRMTLASMLMQPTHDTEKLKKKQTIIKELIENQKTFTDFNEILKKYIKLEQHLLNFFSKQTLTNLFSSENYFPQIIWQLNLLFKILPKSFVEKLELNSIADEINKSNITLTSFNFHNLLTKSKALTKFFKNDLINDTQSTFDECRNNSILRIVWNQIKTILLPIPFLVDDDYSIGDLVGKSLEDTRIIYLQIDEEIKKYKQLKIAYKKLRQISKTIVNIQNLKKIIINTKLNNKISSLNNIEYLFNKKSCGSLDFDKAIKNLKSNIFKKFKTKNAPFIYLYALKGMILSSAYIMANQQAYLVDFMKPFGEIDAYMSIAKLYKESINNNAKFCFTNYEALENSHIKMKNFWSPFIDQKNVITNNIELGGNKNEKCALISGPNAGGKSTVLKSIILNSLLSQTITIAAADECTLTPFSYIDTYLNITDNITDGNSLFKSEVLRVKNLLKNIESNNKSLIIVDEMFSGTNPREGQAASYAIAEYIAQLASKKKQVIALIASHYKEMTNLEKNTLGIFKNYKVTVNIYKNEHKLEYPFKLQLGESDQAVAIDILQSEGLSSKIINSAKKIASKNSLI